VVETILIVEDEPEFAGLLELWMGRAGYRTSAARTGPDGLRRFYDERPDLVILDVAIPGLDGWQLIERIREFSRVPIIMVTARGSEADKIRGLKLGADDYITKPFSIKELLARTEAFLRRRRTHAATLHDFGDCRLDTAARTLTRAGRDVPLSPKEFDLLAHFAAHAGRALSRDTIMATVWGYDRTVTLRSIDRFVNALRQKIEPDPAAPRFLKTVREFGYKFDPPATAG
jgi:DNA-binding response OmpR family regulator